MGRAKPGAPGEGLQPRDESISRLFLWIDPPPALGLGWHSGRHRSLQYSGILCRSPSCRRDRYSFPRGGSGRR
eukprot:4392577-Lingulodinium_polyedra.AAC.1